MRGHVQRRPSVMALGAIMLLIGVVAIGSPIVARGWHLKWLPTASLIREITQSGSFTMDEWAVLRTRTLSRDQELRLAEGLLDKRLRKSYLSADADNWLVAQVLAGSLPRALLERYYSEEMEFWILAPTQIKVGEQATVSIATRFRSAATNNPKSTVLFGGFILNDEPQPQARQVDGVAGIMFGEQRFHVADRDSGPGSSPKIVVDAKTPGSIKIRAELWVVHLPMGTVAQQVLWQTDGVPSLPAGAVWMQKRSIEHVIEVLP